MIKSHNFIFLVVICLGYCKMVHAQETDKLQISANAGYQREDFHWSIAGNLSGQSPNIYSELKWKAISGLRYDIGLQWSIFNDFLLAGDYYRSSTTSGTSNDTDYGGDNRTEPVYDQDFRSNKGNTSAWSACFGYRLIKTKTWRFSPYLGYGIGYQNYYLLGENGSFAQLNSSYKTQWKGPFLRVKSSLNISTRFKVDGELTYNQVNYSAAANWNLIENFQHPASFRHSADGYGVDAGAKIAFRVNRNISANIGAAYFNWETGNGTDQLYLTNGEIDKTQFDGARRDGFRLGLGTNISF